MEIEQRKVSSICIVAPRGRLDSQTVGQFEQAVQTALQGGERRLIIDCAGLEYVSSAGLRAFLVAGKILTRRGGLLAFCSIRPVLGTIFKMTELWSLFPVYDDCGQAIEACMLPRVALLLPGQSPLIDGGVVGFLAGLCESGVRENVEFSLQRFEAGHNLGLLEKAAAEIASGPFDLVVTIGTPALRAFAQANLESQLRHIFFMVADPTAAGVGVSADDPLRHPAHMTGVATLLPVLENFQLLRQCNPGLARVGLPLDPAQPSSSFYARMCRDACAALGVRLLERPFSHPDQLPRTIGELAGDNADAIFLMVDSSIAAGLAGAMEAARAFGLPVFSHSLKIAEAGGLFAIGADFEIVGRRAGDVAAALLRGADPANLPIRYEVPVKIYLNPIALASVKGTWDFPEEMLKKADKIL